MLKFQDCRLLTVVPINPHCVAIIAVFLNFETIWKKKSKYNHDRAVLTRA